jgi:hypothetical protein
MLDALARWWRRRTPAKFDALQLDSLPPDQVERIARDLSMSTSELRLLVSRGSDNTELLRKRMASLQLDPDDLARSEPATLHDLQRLCTTCSDRGRCARDLAHHSADPSWQGWFDYCPNVATLNMLSALKICSESLDQNSRTVNEPVAPPPRS